MHPPCVFPPGRFVPIAARSRFAGRLLAGGVAAAVFVGAALLSARASLPRVPDPPTGSPTRGTRSAADGASVATSARGSPTLEPHRNSDGTWGLVMTGAGLASVDQPQPMTLEWWDEARDVVRTLRGAYTSAVPGNGGLECTGQLSLADGVAFTFHDFWILSGDTVRLQRRIVVHGSAPGGFLSTAALRVTAPLAWPDVEWFVPGMIYGNFDHLRDNSIGARNYYQPGAYAVWIREDRMPAPLLGALFSDGATLAVLNPAPDGATTAAEGASFSLEPMIDARFQFGSIGAEERERTLSLGYSFPGAEGQLSYARKTAQGPETNHAWRRRYHPIKEGFTQRYEVAFRIGRAQGLNDLVAQTWRWAWQALQPRVNPQDLDAIWRHVVDTLAANVVEIADRAGVRSSRSVVPGTKEPLNPASHLGFTGMSLGSAEMLLAESRADRTARGREFRRKAEKIITSFLRIRMNPPAGVGFYLKTGVITPNVVKGRREMYLRKFTDDLKALLRAYRSERQHGIEHPEWLAWVRQFADWLLTQQQPAGGFPRAWLGPAGEVHSASPNSSFNAIPLLVQLNQLTGEPRYLQAAIRAGDFTWGNGQARGRFIGGTIDNPDVIDKEAATISLEGYLALFEATKEPRWLERARAAADSAETWMYLWNVPMPADADDAALHWKRGVPTTGVQLIATGHSLVDAYMAFDVDEYARLYRLTGDAHYREVARLLLHNTKAMIALPGRDYGLRGPGWQQEHYCFTLPRGVGRQQNWLPWVAVSQLQGIHGLRSSDPELFREIAAAAAGSQNFIRKGSPPTR